MRKLEFKEINITSFGEWKKVIYENLNAASHFTIHVWNEEKNELMQALNFGSLIETDWKWGKVIEGEVTKDFKSFILNSEKPSDTEIYNKMTPFFSIFLDNGFSSEHYGTEIYKEEKL